MSRIGTVAVFDTPEAYASSVHNCRASILAIDRGAFEARLALAKLPELSLCLATERLARRAVLSFPPNRVFFRIVAPQDRPRTRSGVVDMPGTITVKSGDSGVEDVTTGPSIARSLSMPIELLLARWESLFESPPPFLFERTLPLRPAPDRLARLRRMHREMVQLASSATSSNGVEARASQMQAAIWSMLIEALSDPGQKEPRSPIRRGPAILRQVAEFINANEDRPVTLGELCAVAGCSAKTLEVLFVRCLGETPNRYLRRWRMWRARETLIRSDPTQTTVSEVAVNYGFWELGRFSVAYRTLFGESPSQTLHTATRALGNQAVSAWARPVLTNST